MRTKLFAMGCVVVAIITDHGLDLYLDMWG